MQDTEKLKVAQYARKLAKLTYQVTERFPRSEIFGLSSQMRRAAVSVGSNIAEGCGRATRKQFLHSLDQAAGEASELEYQCLVAADMNYGRATELEHLRFETERVKKMLARLMAYNRTLPPKRPRGNPPRESPLSTTEEPNNRSE